MNSYFFRGTRTFESAIIIIKNKRKDPGMKEGKGVKAQKRDRGGKNSTYGTRNILPQLKFVAGKSGSLEKSPL